MRVIPVSSVNKWLKNNAPKFVEFSEEEYDYSLLDVAEHIMAKGKERTVVLISGPSGSGKTISSFRLREKLCQLGKNTSILSMDNYFLPDDDPRNELDENGKLDYESPKRLDMELFSGHLSSLLRGESITVPTFNFKEQKRENGFPLQIKSGEAVVIEGIHALNPEVTGDALADSIGVYVSVRTRLETATGDLLHPSKIRLMRRFVRDKLFRGRELSQTLKFFEDVERGENRYIMPHKNNAVFDIDTFLPYEPCIYKGIIMEELEVLARTADEHHEMDKLLAFISNLCEMSPDLVPESSLVREFVGGNVLMHK